ncbi:zinc-ribbon domain-containing protein [Paractinoplanes atraurantiacus]|uniref:zinc-ribbon domain-containing protein n=1 Tax=Paractinoplanes atraurantiacus TaxID=1036182 RepID=UPI001177D6CF
MAARLGAGEVSYPDATLAGCWRRPCCAIRIHTTGSARKVWWFRTAAADHVWEATVNNRTDGSTGCPCCARKKVSVTNSLATISPDVAAQLDPDRNDGLTADCRASPTFPASEWRNTPSAAGGWSSCSPLSKARLRARWSSVS